MNEEHISALVDGELRGEEADAAIDALTADAGLRRAWGRYHMIGEAIRGGSAAFSAASETDEVRATVVELPQPRNRVRGITGLAIAASVAALALALVLLPERDGAEPGFDVASAEATQGGLSPRVVSIQVPPRAGITPVGDYDQRLNGYLVNFNEQRARLGVPGVHPYVRIVGFEAE